MLSNKSWWNMYGGVLQAGGRGILRVFIPILMSFLYINCMLSSLPVYSHIALLGVYIPGDKGNVNNTS
jgi:hypothetical protein